MHPGILTIKQWLIPSSAKLVVISILFQSGIAFTQSGNLVINPSFEKSVDFQNHMANDNWTRCLKNDTPDYIEFTSRGEPEFYYSKYIGGLLPFDGEAYAGIFCFRTNPLRGIENIREFIQVPLQESLQRDTIYTVSLHLALDPESTTAINNFNIYFCREQLFLKKEKQMFELRPRLRFRQSTFDSIGWIKLEGSFRAQGNESQMVLGNFLPDQSLRKSTVHYQSNMMSKWNLHELERASYYYIDMVSVVKASLATPCLDATEPEEEEGEIQKPFPQEEPDSPIIEIEKVDRDSSIVLNNIFFEFDESKLLKASYTELDRLNDQLQKFRELSIVIEGHTDNMGTYEYNITLSQERAKAVANYLIENGLKKDRISFKGYGYTRPLSDNRTEMGRSLNRRVAFRIIEMNKLKP